MISDAWKCRCATLRFNWERGTYPSGQYNQDYECEAKKFFTSLLNRQVFSQVGGWVKDCNNYECSGFKYVNGKGVCASKDKNSWCDQCICVRQPLYADCCTCKTEFCPFFKERQFDEWKSLALRGQVPLINSKGGLRAEAKAAKRLFGVSDEDFAKIVEARMRFLGNLKAAVKDETEKKD